MVPLVLLAAGELLRSVEADVIPSRTRGLCAVVPSTHGYWLSVGAQPSDPVQRILFRAGLLPPPPMLAMARKGGPRDRRPIHPMTGRPLDLEGVTIVDDSNAPGGDAEEPTDEVAS
ncbi:hypothetical protein U9M48_014803 [Paspalum notatum var. saurae]|uniref:Uncharacterized protein n=1 Tax=Paspalum notatum var. saurae TaxID=547442 RepID=A0AAQ3WKY1_PASNO